MHWEDYRSTYQSYELSVNQTRVLTIVGREVLSEFPEKLPKAIREPVASTMAQIRNAFELAEGKGGRGPIPYLAELDITDTHELVAPVLAMYLALAWLGASHSDADFQRALLSQQLVMLFAHLDAFMSDSLETICRVRPEVLKSSRTLTWETTICFGGWEQLLDHLIEQYVLDFGRKTLSDRVRHMRERLGLVIDCDDGELEFLEEAENLRHIVVHNGGRASEEYIRRTGLNGLALGEFVPIRPEYVYQVSEVTRLLASGVFVGTTEKFFGKKPQQVTGIWRRRTALR